MASGEPRRSERSASDTGALRGECVASRHRQHSLEDRAAPHPPARETAVIRGIAASCRLLAVVRADTADALRRAAFRIVELTDDCWKGSRRVGSGTATSTDYVAQVGPWSSVTLQFGEISAAEPWISIESTWPGEYGRRGAGDGYIQVFTHDEPAEQKARWKLAAAAALSNAVRRLEHDAEATPPWLTEEERDAIKRSTATVEDLSLDGETVGFCSFEHSARPPHRPTSLIGP